MILFIFACALFVLIAFILLYIRMRFTTYTTNDLEPIKFSNSTSIRHRDYASPTVTPRINYIRRTPSHRQNLRNNDFNEEYSSEVKSSPSPHLIPKTKNQTGGFQYTPYSFD